MQFNGNVIDRRWLVCKLPLEHFEHNLIHQLNTNSEKYFLTTTIIMTTNKKLLLRGNKKRNGAAAAEAAEGEDPAPAEGEPSKKVARGRCCKVNNNSYNLYHFGCITS
jgi:hypothetical protein